MDYPINIASKLAKLRAKRDDYLNKAAKIDNEIAKIESK